MLAPARARRPISAASCEPTVQALGCRAQNSRRSCTTAAAAEMASAAPISWGDTRGDPPPGSRISTRPSQNTIRKRKNMDPASLAVRSTIPGNKIAAGLESRVPEIGSFLFIIAQITRQIFDNLQGTPEKIIYLKLAQTILPTGVRRACPRLRRAVTVPGCKAAATARSPCRMKADPLRG